MKATTTLAACFCALLVSAVASAEQFYKWIDAQGTTHYTEDPPPPSATNSSEVRVSTRQPSGSDAAPPAPAAKNSNKTDNDKKAKTDSSKNNAAVADKDPERCKILQDNLQAMQSHGRVKMTDANGEVRVLSDDEKQQQMDSTQKQIKTFCD